MKKLLKEYVRSLMEMPHIEASGAVLRSLGMNNDIMIDFRVELMNLTQDEKRGLLKAFYNGGFVGELEGEWFTFLAPNNEQPAMRIATQEDIATLPHLPKNWVETAIIL